MEVRNICSKLRNYITSPVYINAVRRLQSMEKINEWIKKTLLRNNLFVWGGIYCIYNLSKYRKWFNTKCKKEMYSYWFRNKYITPITGCGIPTNTFDCFATAYLSLSCTFDWLSNKGIQKSALINHSLVQYGRLFARLSTTCTRSWITDKELNQVMFV